MKVRALAVLLGALALSVSRPSLAGNQGGNGGGNQGGNGQGGVSAPEFDGQMIALGLALAGSASIALRGRLRRPRQ